MPLQVRRGTETQRTAMTEPLASGELLYVTNTGTLYIGNGTAIGGIPVASLSEGGVRDISAALLTGGTHVGGISFAYDGTNVNATLDFELSNYQGVITASAFKGSVFADDGSTIGGIELVNAIDGSINLDGTVKGNIIPDSDSTYDIGSSALKFKDLYLSGTSLYLGDAVITSSGSAVELPAGSTVGGVEIGGGGGIVPGSNYNINIIGDDSSTIVDVATNTLTGNIVTGLISSSDSNDIIVDTPVFFQTRVSIQDSLQVFDTSIFDNEMVVQTNSSSNRMLTLSQHHSDPSTASSLTLRRSRGSLSFPLNVQSGDIVGSITGTARVSSGYVASSLITLRTSGTVTSTVAPGTIEFFTTDSTGVLQNRLTVDNTGTTTINGAGSFITQAYSSVPFVSFTQYHSTADARNLTFSRARGTFDTPIAVNNNDDIADFQFAAFDGVQFVTPCAISAIVDAAPNTSNGANSTPGRLEFLTNNGINSATRVRIDSDGMLEALFGLEVTGQVDFITVAQPTVGAAGAANALPATPSTYFKIKVNGVEYVVPAYAVS